MVEEMTLAELMEEENEEETNTEDFEEIGFDDEDEEEVYCGETAKTVTVIAQPVKTTVRVGAEKDSNGQVKPNCSFAIERNLTDDVDEFEFMADDFEMLIEKVKETMTRFEEE